LSGLLGKISQPSDTFSEAVIDNSDELSDSSGLLRSRSSSDDKEPSTSCGDAENGNLGVLVDSDIKFFMQII